MCFTRKNVNSFTNIPIALSFPGKNTAEDESAGLSKQYNINRKGIYPTEQTSQNILNFNSLKRKFRFKKPFPPPPPPEKKNCVSFFFQKKEYVMVKVKRVQLRVNIGGFIRFDSI